jgi:hypothetical protein
MSFLELLDDDDDILSELADVLNGFEEYVGGANHATSLFKLFEALCKVSDSNVRDKV